MLQILCAMQQSQDSWGTCPLDTNQIVASANFDLEIAPLKRKVLKMFDIYRILQQLAVSRASVFTDLERIWRSQTHVFI